MKKILSMLLCIVMVLPMISGVFADLANQPIILYADDYDATIPDLPASAKHKFGAGTVELHGAVPFAETTIAYEDRYGRQMMETLGKDYVTIYDAFVNMYANFVEKYEIPDGMIMTPDDINTIYRAYLNDYGEHFWTNSYAYGIIGGNVVEIYPRFIAELASNAKIAEFENAAVSYLAEIGITEANVKTFTQPELSLKLHDALTDHLHYVTGAENAHNAYGALIGAKCVCEGYVELYQYLLYLVGIMSHRIEGMAKSSPEALELENHVWNLVLMNGKYYLTDITWDDYGDGDWGRYYTYYCVTTDIMNELHYPNMPYDIPTCTETDQIYSLKNPDIVVDSTTATAEVVNQLGTQGHRFARILYNDSEVSFTDWLDENISDIVEGVGLSGSLMYSWVNVLEEYHLLIFSDYYIYCRSDAGYQIQNFFGHGPDGDHFTIEKDASFRFRVVVDENHYKGDDYRVLFNGESLLADAGGFYDTPAVKGDSVITVRGVEARISLAEKNIVVNNGDTFALEGDTLTATALDGLTIYEPTLDWQWFRDETAITEKGNYAPYTVKAEDVGHSITLQVSPKEESHFGGIGKSQAISIIVRTVPTLTVTPNETILCDMSPVVIGASGSEPSPDIVWTTDSDCDVDDIVVRWYTYGDGEPDEENLLPSAPVNAGRYLVTVSLPMTLNYRSKTVVTEFTIAMNDTTETVAPTLSLKSESTLTVNVAEHNGIKQKYLIRPLSSPAYSMADDDPVTGWLSPLGVIHTFRYLEAFTTYRIYTYWAGDGVNYAATEVSFTDFTTDKIVVAIPAADKTAFVYNGHEQQYKLTPSEYYDITGAYKTNAGAWTVRATLKDKQKTEWSDHTSEDKLYNFVIAKKELTYTMIAVEGDGEFGYNGLPICPEITVTDAGVGTLLEDVDYKVSYHAYEDDSFILPGDYYIKVEATANGNYTGSFSGGTYSNAKLQYSIVKGNYSGDPLTAYLKIRTDSAVNSTYSLLKRVVYENLPTGLVINNLEYFTQTSEYWQLIGTDLKIISDVSALSGDGGTIVLSLLSDVYNDVDVTVRLIYVTPVTEITPIDSGCVVGDCGTLGRCVRGVAGGLTVAQFKALFEQSDDIRVYNPDSIAALEDSDIVKTGCTAKLFNIALTLDTVTVIVDGDTDGDGLVTTADSLRALKYAVGLQNIGELYSVAAEVSGDGSVTSVDALKILRVAVGLDAGFTK